MTKPLDLTGITKVVVLTGAGVSVSSGLRPYRGVQSYRTHRARA